MKNLVFESISLVSHVEKKARKILFDPNLNVIRGRNDTGKSTIIKSLYYSLGADIKLHNRLKPANVTFLLRFTIDDRKYMIIRRDKCFSLYDETETLIGIYNKITAELAPALAKLFSFNLTIPNRYTSSSVIPPPAFMYVAYYLDQDRSWNNIWNSFENLGQFSKWKERVANYHIGMKPDRWYELEAQRSRSQIERDEPERKLEVLKKISTSTAKQITEHKLNHNIDQFQDEIELLLEELNAQKLVQDKYRVTMHALHDSRSSLERQISLLSSTIVELNKDYEFAVNKLDVLVNCPTCGAEHDNSLNERFHIADDSETCSELLAELKADHIEVMNRIEREEVALEKISASLLKVEVELSSKEGMLKLKDVIQLAGRNSLLDVLKQDISTLNAILDKLTVECELLTEEMKLFTGTQRQKDVLEEYSTVFRDNCIQLNVSVLDEKIYSKTCPSLNESGSDLPRLILAYFFTVIHLAKKNESSTICPIVIDAPKQQEQDVDNYPIVLKFLQEKRPINQQMIVGLVDDGDFDIGGKTTVLTEKYSVMTSEEYPEAAAELQKYELDQVQSIN